MYEALGNVSLDLLRTFEAAARHRSFTAAAQELGTTQPAISHQPATQTAGTALGCSLV